MSVNAPCQIEQIAAYLDGELSDAASAQLEQHIRQCSGCNAELGRQRQLLCTLDSAFNHHSDLELPRNFARSVAAHAESDMRGVRERSERRRALRLCLVLAAVSFALLGMASSPTVFNVARSIVRSVSGVLDLVWSTVYDAVAGLAVITRVLSKGFIPESPLAGFIEFLLLALAVVLLSRLIARYHRTRLTE
jgi:anti-sigma factor RsiW